MRQFDIPLSGLSCMGCARKVERELTSQHRVNIHDLTPQHITLDSDSPFVDLEQSIQSLGYQAGHQYQFHLSGLSCGKCVAKLESALEESDDIGQFDVSKTTLSLSTLLTQQQVKDLVASLGYQASESESEIEEPETQPQATQPSSHLQSSNNKETLHFLISGMTCASCVASVERALTQVEGVDKAQVNLAEQSALVFSTSKDNKTINAIANAVEEAGYQAEIVDDPATQQEKQQAQQMAVQAHHKKSAWAGIVIGVPLMLWGVLGGNMMIRTSQDQLIWGVVGIICFWLLATAGKSFFSNAWQALTHKRATMDTLVALGTGAAWLFSMLVVAFPDWFPPASRHVYFEASAMIVGLISLGHYIEAKAKAKTTRSLQALINLQPNEAVLITESGDQVIAIDQITEGMQLRIKPGEKAPIDGHVVSGESYLDESMLTGEPVPVYKQSGDTISAGTLNQDGSLVIEATGVGSNTMLSRIITMVREAQSSKPAIAKLADQISSVFVPVVVAIALFSALVWFMVGPDPKASYMLVVTTTVLIIACPCALGLATPLSVTVGIGKAAEMGILIKDADVLQSASNIDTVVFDKTGTLTQGKPDVQHIFALNQDDKQLLTAAASLEQYSEHPLAKAIVKHAQEHQLSLGEVRDFNNMRGMGVTGVLENESIAVVSLPYAQKQELKLEGLEQELQRCADNAWTPVIVVQQNQVSGLIAIADPIKQDAKQAVDALFAMQITPVMLTGDNQHVAKAIAQQLGIEQVISQVLPDEKAGHVAQIQASGKRVAMIGDGVNDAPALALADIGIAMGSGSDVAIESAQMTLLNSSPLAVVKAIELSKATIKNMKQNLFGAFIYNSLGIPVAAGVLYPAFGFLLSPVVAGAAMALSSITVVSNANRLRLFKSSIRS
ncbi:heavy metal translocating P-type ATPase [Vibrio coralliilyticus]|uniref:heavy metal translocating P-type ATPase n=1 Tax=Vibrio coralliilyticus TaxID=190893 RepID=UPI002409EB45|nr:heavy metal translocating P-type ATPase [Vibrio coralliilyticus]WFB48877.1 heavy metal translocating P-type ATPase [Vibrio coralliilyticus]